MFQILINSLLVVCSLLFLQMKHPLSMGLILLIQTLLISCLIGLINKTFWYSYILFLVFLGGMLVMFIYVTSLSSNEMFSISNKLIFYLSSFFLLIFIVLNLMDLFFLNNFLNLETSNFNETLFMMEENSLSLMKLYNYSTNLVTLFLMNYLFLTLVISVKITNFFYGPLRPSFN